MIVLITKIRAFFNAPLIRLQGALRGAQRRGNLRNIPQEQNVEIPEERQHQAAITEGARNVPHEWSVETPVKRRLHVAIMEGALLPLVLILLLSACSPSPETTPTPTTTHKPINTHHTHHSPTPHPTPTHHNPKHNQNKHTTPNTCQKHKE